MRLIPDVPVKHLAVRAAKIFLRAVIRVMAVLGGYMLATGYTPGARAILDVIDAAGLYAIVFALCGFLLDILMQTNRVFWRYSSISDVPKIVGSSTVLVLVFLVAAFLLQRAVDLPRLALLLVWVLDVTLTLGLLLTRRLLNEPGLLVGFPGAHARDGRSPVVVVGGLDHVDAFLREIERGAVAFRPIMVLSKAAERSPREIRGIRVIGDADRVVEVLEGSVARGEGAAVVFTDQTYSPADFGMDRLGRLRARGVKLMRIPSLAEVDGGQDVGGVREIRLEELLPRPPITLDERRVKRLVSGRRVLVTGGGGSIGSEICRQAAILGCSHLTFIDNSEFSLFKMDQEIGDRWPTLSRRAVLADVRNRTQIAEVMASERPEIVFHAAALKHVPLMERHPREAILTNVLGTHNVAEAATAAGAGHMIFISTDKAVDPPNVMGATKRLAEAVIRAYQTGGGKTRFSAVRFGNVLGSAGSVVPTFRAQIERGGPVTLTHPEIERYFMTIPEAVQLVLHATAKAAERPEGPLGVYVLDMGKPVKIIDLARQLIELYGLVPGRDIEIAVTGLRPGEKLFEELVDTTEEISFQDESVMCVVDRRSGLQMTSLNLGDLRKVATDGDDSQARQMVFDLVAQVRAADAPAPSSEVIPLKRV